MTQNQFSLIKKDWTSRTLVNPPPPTSDKISFLPHPPPLTVDVICVSPLSLCVKYLSGRSSFFLHLDLIKSVTVWTFQIKQYVGCGGLLLKHQQPKNKFWGVPPLASLECGHEKQILQTNNYL